MKSRITFAAIIATAALAILAPPAIAEPPTRWLYPPADSQCWASYEMCQLAAKAAHEAHHISDTQFAQALTECTNGLMLCGWFDRLRRVLGDDVAAAYIAAVGAREAAEIDQSLSDCK
jgi:hypothetical protein